MSPTSNGTNRPFASRADRLSVENVAFLRAELQRQPETRAEVVARGRDLAADPDYPSWEILSSVARQVLAAPDFSDEES